MLYKKATSNNAQFGASHRDSVFEKDTCFQGMVSFIDTVKSDSVYLGRFYHLERASVITPYCLSNVLLHFRHAQSAIGPLNCKC
jgi:hypothetical protein